MLHGAKAHTSCPRNSLNCCCSVSFCLQQHNGCLNNFLLRLSATISLLAAARCGNCVCHSQMKIALDFRVNHIFQNYWLNTMATSVVVVISK